MLGEISGDQFVDQAGQLGFQLGSGKIFVAVTNKGERVDTTALLVRNSFGTNAISADMGDYLITVAPQQARARVEEIAREDKHLRGGGTSRDVAPEQIAVAVRQAKSAAAVARSSGRLLNFDDVGVERILVILAEGPELASFVEDELGSLLDADAKSHTPMLPTLRAFLAADGRKTDAADALYIQRRTLYNRLDRISKILGSSLDDPDIRQRLHLAVKGLDLLGGL